MGMRGSTLVLGSALSAAVSAAVTLWLVHRRLENAPKEPSSRKRAADRPVVGRNFSPEIVDEQTARTRAFLKDSGMNAVRKASVTVVGVGGVGSWVATMLVRSGIGKITLIDFDQVSLSSLNRHASATLADVGTPKVDSLAQFLRSVAPWVEIVALNELWTKDRGPALLAGSDYVVDCIDNLETKVDLLEHCVKSGLRIISSMGAGAKADPTRIMVGDISQTYEDPLSRTVRVMLRQRGVSGGIPTVYSTEKPGKDKAQLLDVADEEVDAGQIGELSVLKDFRVRILPVLGPLPAIFGLTIATHLLCTIGEYASVFDPATGGYSVAGKNRLKLYDQLMHSINNQFQRLKLDSKTTHVTLDEVEYLIEEVWRGKTLNGETSRQKLTLWDPSGPYTIRNMVPVNRSEQQRHEQLVFREGRPLADVYSAAELDEVRRRMALDRWYTQFRVN